MTLDNLIEELTRRQTKAMAFEREHGLEALVTLSIDEVVAIRSALKESQKASPWKLFYGDGLNLKQIAERLGCSVYDLSPWLTAPLTRCDGHPFQTALNAAHEENKRMRHWQTLAEAVLREISQKNDVPADNWRRKIAADTLAALQPQGEK